MTTLKLQARPERNLAFVGWLPLIILPVVVMTFGTAWPRWVFMWTLAFAIFFGCKWLTWWNCRAISAPAWRHVGYLFAWVGMDAKTFLRTDNEVQKPGAKDWLAAVLKTIFGATLLWLIARKVPANAPLARGWIGMLGIVFLLHFGVFHLLALMWQRIGVGVRPLMHVPILANSVADFWGRRWNAGFQQIVNQVVFRPLHRRIGAAGATMLVFLISGLIHELVISLPARAGYGLPTAYFLTQGAGLLFERTTFARNLGLRRGGAGWVFTLVITAGPAFFLFHPPFVQNVILPFMRAVHAI